MNKKGLSTVVTTLIVILLVLVAIAIIWVVIRNVIESGAGQIDVRSTCLGIDLKIINELTRFSCEGAYPDITYLLDIDEKIGLAKASKKEFGDKPDKIEERGPEYHRRVNEGYREMARENPNRFKIIHYYEGQPEAMHEQIREHTKVFIREHQLEDVLARG